MEIVIVVPTYNGGEDLKSCLRAIAASSRKPDKVIVVDDGSTDNVARQEAGLYNFDYVRVTDGPTGPAKARNIGVTHCEADVVVFVDSDVVIHSDAIQQTHDYFADHPDVSALFGSYDADPAVDTLVSRYKNLLHHFVHQHSNREANTFWAGFGAVRTDAFNAVKGFDETYEKPCIEDIDLGLRLSQANYKIALCPEIQVKHLKHWTLSGMIRTDIFNRAIPWTQLIIDSGTGLKNDLNTRTENRISALVCFAITICLLGMLLGYNTFAALIFLVLVYLYLDRKLFNFFFRIGGIKLTVGAAALHFLYYLYASATFVTVSLISYLQKTFSKSAPAAHGGP